MYEPANSQNTRMMRNLGRISEIADAMGEQGFDVHTVTITLNNGDWDVNFEYTDDDMESGVKEFAGSSYGDIEPV